MAHFFESLTFILPGVYLIAMLARESWQKRRASQRYNQLQAKFQLGWTPGVPRDETKTGRNAKHVFLFAAPHYSIHSCEICGKPEADAIHH